MSVLFAASASPAPSTIILPTHLQTLVLELIAGAEYDVTSNQTLHELIAGAEYDVTSNQTLHEWIGDVQHTTDEDLVWLTQSLSRNRANHPLLIAVLPHVCSAGRILVLEWTHKNVQGANNLGEYVLKGAFNGAWRKLNLPVARYLYQHAGLTIAIMRSYFYDTNSSPFWRPANYGRLDAVQFLHQEVGMGLSDARTPDREAMYMACTNGHLDVVRYLHDSIGMSHEDVVDNNGEALTQACIGGHLGTVRYLIEQFGVTKDDMLPFPPFSDMLAEAAHWGHLDVCKYLVARFELDGWSDIRGAFELACANGKVDIVNFFVDHYKLDQELVQNNTDQKDLALTIKRVLFDTRRLAIVQCLDKRLSFYLDREAWKQVFLHSVTVERLSSSVTTLELVQYLYDKCTVEKEELRADDASAMMDWACQANKLDIAQFLQSTFQFATKDVEPHRLVHSACRMSDNKLLKWLDETFEIEPAAFETPAYHASAHGKMAVLDYLAKQGYISAVLAINLCTEALTGNHHTMVRWLVNQFSLLEKDTLPRLRLALDKVADHAVRHCDLETLQFIWDELKLAPENPDVWLLYVKAACDNGDLVTVQYLCEWPGVVGEWEVKLNAWVRDPSRGLLVGLCEQNFHEIFEYLHTRCKLTADDIRALKNLPLVCATSARGVETLRYLYLSCGLTIDDIRGPPDANKKHKNKILQAACAQPYIEVVEFLVETVGLDDKDVLSLDPGNGSIYPHIAEYLEKRFGFYPASKHALFLDQTRGSKKLRERALVGPGKQLRLEREDSERILSEDESETSIDFN